MLYNQPYGVSDPNGAYVNGNPATGTAGSIPPAASIEFPQREIVNFISDVGIVPDNSDLHQLARSVQSGMVCYGVDTGTTNDYAITLTPPLLKYYDGLQLWVIPGNTNTGPGTLNVNALGVRNIVRRGGGPLGAGDMPSGYKSLLTYSALHANFELYGINFGSGTTGFLPILTANTNLYVNAAIGDDTLYDGSAAAISGPHGPFKTIARATAETFKYGPSVYTMTINIANGTYGEAVVIPGVVGPTTLYNGNNRSGVFVTGADSQHTFNAGHANTILIKHLTMSCGGGTGPPCCVSSSGGASVNCDDLGSQGVIPYSVYESYNGFISAGTHMCYAGNTCEYFWSAFFGGFLGVQQGKAITFAGSFSCGGAFAAASAVGTMEMPVPGYPAFVNPGNVSGTKYLATINGAIVTQGLGTGFFPGNSAGYVNTGGQYN